MSIVPAGFIGIGVEYIIRKTCPTLLEDFILRENITLFDHERIPKRIVHARATGAHGPFELTASLKDYTTAGILSKVGEKTPVFTRISTVAGGAGSVDTPRDVRGRLRLRLGRLCLTDQPPSLRFAFLR